MKHKIIYNTMIELKEMQDLLGIKYKIVVHENDHIFLYKSNSLLQPFKTIKDFSTFVSGMRSVFCIHHNECNAVPYDMVEIKEATDDNEAVKSWLEKVID